jgi:hypothetical protein
MAVWLGKIEEELKYNRICRTQKLMEREIPREILNMERVGL